MPHPLFASPIMPFWTRLAHYILERTSLIVGALVVITVFLGYWAFQVRTDQSAGNFMSADSQELIDLRRLQEQFGQTQSILYVVFSDVSPYDPAFLEPLDRAVGAISGYKGVDYVLSLTNVPFLTRSGKDFAPQPLYQPGLDSSATRMRFQGQPFLRRLLLSSDGRRAGMLIKVNAAFNDTPERVALVDSIEAALEPLPGTLAFAGFPYLRTEYARRVTRESPLFAGLAILISLFFLYVTFRSWRAVLLPAVVVVLGILWTIGLFSLFGQKLNIVSAALPALIVIIGMATGIHLCTKFFDEYQRLGSARDAVIRTIETVGMATFLTCLTTAIGFWVLILSGSPLLSTFGIFAGAGIMLLYVLAITVIPIAFGVLRPPSMETAALATNDRFARFFDHLAGRIERHKLGIMIAAGIIAAAGVLGATRLSSDIFAFSDFRTDDPLRRDLAVFEDNFGGILPLEVVIDAKKPGQFRTIANLRRIERLQSELMALPPVTRALSTADLVKVANQAYFGGNPKAYRLPSTYELPFLQTALRSVAGGTAQSTLMRNIPRVVDSTFTSTRVFLGVRDIGTTHMNALIDSVRLRAEAAFPPDRFDVTVAGTAITVTRSGESLVRNLILSLGLALLIISGIMAVLFRSFPLTLISLIPNIIPLILVGGAMGLAGIHLKPSTALIFSLAFGIAVDDTIHFLSKYRLLRKTGLDSDMAVRVTLRETGKAILFTSLVLMAGFLVFTFSSFGGTVTMGALTALTLGAALLANLLLLPALLFRFAPPSQGPAVGDDRHT